MHLSNIVQDKALNSDHITLTKDTCRRKEDKNRRSSLFEIGADNEVAQTATTTYYGVLNVFQAKDPLINLLLDILYRILLHIKVELE